MDAGAEPSISGVSHLGLSVTNLDRSLAFYRDVLGTPVMREPYQGDRAAFDGRMALVLLGTVGLDLFEHAANPGDSFAPERTGLDHLAVSTDSLDALHAWASRLDAEGIPRSSIRETDAFGSMFDFRDPDGIQLEFFFFDLEAFADSDSMS